MTRHLKIFISSTFQDMQEEREILLKETFLELKKIAKKRDVEVTEIDLRTGITEKQEKSGQIVKICLDEIERCTDSPIFFLGMLGNRYGWDEWHLHTDKNTLEDKKYSWIKEHIGKSVTELEIVSALERVQNNNRAFLYFKKQKENDDQRLIDLKNRLIKKSEIDNQLYVTHYKNADEFRERTIESFSKALDELYPKDKKLKEVERLRTIHQIFAKSRQKIYIPHSKNENILKEFIANEQDRLLLYGESGYGKSALIANYFKHFSKKSETFVIEHYIGGAGESSNDLYQMLRHVMLEIKEEFDLSDEVPSEAQKIMDEFALWLHRVKRPTIIILDGYNQIEDEIKKKLFYYLPDKLENVKLIITSIRDDYDINNKHKIEALNQEEKNKLITNYLKAYGKTLDDKMMKQIITHAQTNNTLFLKTLLDEIRLLSNFNHLQINIENYLNSKDIVQLFMKIFVRLEKDYRKSLLKEVLSLLYISRDGLSEDNLMEIINQNSTNKLTRLEFSPLFLAIEEHLIDRDGLYGFFHGFVLEAVERRYFSGLIVDEKYQNGMVTRNNEREKLIHYFEKIEIKRRTIFDLNIDNQVARELPFHLYEKKDRNRLYKVFLDVEFFVFVKGLNEYELLEYIQYIDKSFDIGAEITKYLLDVNYDGYIITEIAYFLQEVYPQYNNALVLFKKTVEINKDEESQNMAKSITNLAGCYTALGIFDKALPLYTKSLKMHLVVSGINHTDTASTYTDLGFLYKSKKMYDKAFPLYKKALEIKEKLFGIEHIEVSRIYNNLAVLYKVQGKYKEALPFYQKSLAILEKDIGRNSLNIAISWDNLAELYRIQGEYEKAQPLYVKSIEVLEDILGVNHPDVAINYNNFSIYYYHIEEYEKSYKYMEKAIKIIEQISPNNDNYPNLAERKQNLEIIQQEINKKTILQNSANFKNKSSDTCIVCNNSLSKESYLTKGYNPHQRNAFKCNETKMYGYRCDSCGTLFHNQHRIYEGFLIPCPNCGLDFDLFHNDNVIED